jgi:hypothetical protein
MRSSYEIFNSHDGKVCRNLEYMKDTENLDILLKTFRLQQYPNFGKLQKANVFQIKPINT